MSDLYLHLLKIAVFTCLMIAPFLFVGWIVHRILDRPWRVTRWKKLRWSIERRLTMVRHDDKWWRRRLLRRQRRSGWWLLILMTWDLLWWRPPKEE